MSKFKKYVFIGVFFIILLFTIESFAIEKIDNKCSVTIDVKQK